MLWFLSLAIDYGTFFSIRCSLPTYFTLMMRPFSRLLPFSILTTITFPSILFSCSPITPARIAPPVQSHHHYLPPPLTLIPTHTATLQSRPHTSLFPSQSHPPNTIIYMVGKPGANRAVPAEHPNSEQLGPSTAAANAGPPGHTQYGHRWNTARIVRHPRHRHRRGRHCFCGGYRCAKGAKGAKCAKCGQRG